MVVAGLSEYISSSTQLRRVYLSVLAGHLQRETGKRPKLLLRFSTTRVWIWAAPGAVLRDVGDYPTYTAVSGPDLHLVADRARCFVRALKSIGIDPVVFVDVSSADLADEEVLEEQKSIMGKKMLESYLVQQMLEGTTFPTFEGCRPNQLAERQMLHSLREEGAEFVFCTHQSSMQAIARYARSHEETCGVVSSEADFALVSGCVLFPRAEFDCEKLVGLRRGVSVDDRPGEIVAMAISSSGLAESLEIREDQLPELAVLCGTKDTHLFLGRLSVLTALGVEESGVEGIAAWLRGREEPLLENKVIKDLCSAHPEFLEAIVKCYRTFAVGESPLIDASSFASPVCELVEREMVGHCSLAAGVARGGYVKLPVLLESLTLGQPSILETLRPLRLTMYSLLGVSSVREFGRTASKASEQQVVSVCSSEEEAVAAVQRLHSLRGMEKSQKLWAVYNLSTTLSVESVGCVLGAVDSAVESSQSLPEMEWAKLHKLALLCCGLRLMALLNSSSSLFISDEEMDGLLVASLTSATEGKILPHIVHILPSMKAVSIAEWFCTVVDSIYQLAGIVGLTEGSPEPRNLFYPMVFLPYHLALETHSGLTPRQRADVNSVKTALRVALSLPSVAEFRSSVFDVTSSSQTLPDLIELCSSALEEVLEHTEELLPRTMTAPLAELFRPKQGKESERESSEEDEESEESESEEWGREELPIMEHREEILALVQSHQVVCIEGETGCGKSSQVPQFLLQQFPDSRVLVSQPNSLAAQKLAERVEEEMGVPGNVVTYCDEIRTEEGGARLVYGTNRYVLQALLAVKEECGYTHVILDEVHERTVDIDFGMFLARQLATRLPELKIILMSATLQGELFVQYFRQALGPDRVCSPFFVGLRRFPVHVVFIDELSELVEKKRDAVQAEAMGELVRLQKRLDTDSSVLAHSAEVSTHARDICINLVLSILEPGETVLIFLPGLSDIIDLQNYLLRRLRQVGARDRFRVFVLHRQVAFEDEREIFDRPQPGQANVIISTTIAESSITIPHLKLVIDFAIRRYMIYNPNSHISKLTRKWCSKASCTQRAGRVGRVSPGTAVHLITRGTHKNLPDFNLSEIISSPLSKTVLRAKQLIGKGCGVSLPSRLLGMLIEPPSLLQFEAALHDLVAIGAILHDPRQPSISEEAGMTLLGEFCASLPLDLHLCRLVLLGILFGCPNDAVVLAAGLSMYQDIFTLPTRMIMENMRRFCESLSRSTFSRLSLDAGCYSKPIMVRNLYLEWLRFADIHWTDNRREMANHFSAKFSIRVTRLLHFETSVADTARAVAKWLPPGSRARLELEALSRVERQRLPAPVICSNTYFTSPESPNPSPPPPVSLRPHSGKYVPPHLRNLPRHRLQKAIRQLHFCDNYLLLKMLITAASPSEIMMAERRCDSSLPATRRFARRCIAMAEEEEFRLSHTLSMNLSATTSLDIWVERLRETNEATIRELYNSFPSEFRFPVNVRLERETNAAVVCFDKVAEAKQTIARIARDYGYNPGSDSVEESSAELARLSPEFQFLWRLGEYRELWEVEGVNAVFSYLHHPNKLSWLMLDKERRRVDTALLNFRNPTALMCVFQEPAYPYLAVASRSFKTDSRVTMAPDMTLLPPPPQSLVMILSFQLPTSLTELLVDRAERKVKGLRLNCNEIPCKDIGKHLSVQTLAAINRFRLSLSEILSLTVQDRQMQRSELESSELRESLAALLSPSPTTPSEEATSSPAPTTGAEEGSGEGARLVWEMVTPGQLVGSRAGSDASALYYPELRCSLLGLEPYSESPSHCEQSPASPGSPPVQYLDTPSTRLIRERFDCLEDSEDEESSELSETGWKRKRGEGVASPQGDDEKTDSAAAERARGVGGTEGEEDSARNKSTPDQKEEAQSQRKEEVSPNVSFSSLVVGKLEQEVVRHLQRNNKMEFLSELRVQRRIKHMCTLIRTTLSVPFFLQRPRMFQVREVEEEEGEGVGASSGDREYLIVLDRSQWREVDSEEEEPVLPPSMRILSRAKKAAASSRTPPVVTEGTQTEEVAADSGRSRPNSAGERPLAKETRSSPSKPLTATKAMKFSESKSGTPHSAYVVEDRRKAESAKAPSRGSGGSESSDCAKPPPKEFSKKTATVVTKKRTPALPGTDEHLALHMYEFTKKRGGEVRLAALRREAFPEYCDNNPNPSGYRFLRKALLLDFPEYFEVFEVDKILYVRLVGEKTVTRHSESKTSGNGAPAHDSKQEKKPAKLAQVKESAGSAKKEAESPASPQKKGGSSSELGTDSGKLKSTGKLAKMETAGGDKQTKSAADGGRPETQVFFVHVPSSSRRSQEPVGLSEPIPVSSGAEPSPSTHNLSQLRFSASARERPLPPETPPIPEVVPPERVLMGSNGASPLALTSQAAPLQQVNPVASHLPQPPYPPGVLSGTGPQPSGGPPVQALPTVQPRPPVAPPPPPAQPVEEEEEWHSSEESWLSEDELWSQPQGSPDHVAHYLHSYLTTHSFPFGCTIAELDRQYQNDYKKRFGSRNVARITLDLVKSNPELFKVRDELFITLKEGAEVNSFRGRPYTPEHVNDYYSRYLGKQGVVCSMSEAQDVFDRLYKKQHKMPPNPLIWFLSDTFFKKSLRQFVIFTDAVVFTARGKR